MREILFRGKRVDNGEWVYGDLTNEPSDQVFIRWIYKPSDNVYSHRNFKDLVIPETVGQYTGLKDKNGNKIFEGDILNKCFVVVYNVDGFQLKRGKYTPTRSCYWEWKTREITGNIHDNKELLK